LPEGTTVSQFTQGMWATLLSQYYNGDVFMSQSNNFFTHLMGVFISVQEML